MGVDYSQQKFVWHESGYEYSKTLKGVSVDDITFHYRYEAKVYTHIKEYHPELFKDTTLFWVIGSVPDLETTARNLGKEIPETIKVFEWKEKSTIEEWEQKMRVWLVEFDIFVPDFPDYIVIVQKINDTTFWSNLKNYHKNGLFQPKLRRCELNKIIQEKMIKQMLFADSIYFAILSPQTPLVIHYLGLHMTTLYIKTYNKTGLKYFGKTTKQGKDFDNYRGSGVYWLNHLKKHGDDISTEIYAQFEDNDPLLEETALKFSEENDIMDSNEWANLKFENGKDGGSQGGELSPMFGKTLSKEARKKVSESKMGKARSQETKEKLSIAHSGKTLSKEHIQKISDSHKGKKHSEETKRKMSESQIGEKNAMFGKKQTDEAKKKISKATKGENHPRAIIVVIKDLFGQEVARGVRKLVMLEVGIPLAADKYIDNGRLYADIKRKCGLTRNQNLGNLRFCGWTIETLSKD